MLQRLDDELARLMFTLQGVMRTEFGEGLDLQASADEASIEVLAPGRALVLARPDGRLLARWGTAIDGPGARRRPSMCWRPSRSAAPRMRVRSERVRYQNHRVHRCGHGAAARTSKKPMPSCGARSASASSSRWAWRPSVAGWSDGRRSGRWTKWHLRRWRSPRTPPAIDCAAPHPDDELGRLAHGIQRPARSAGPNAFRRSGSSWRMHRMNCGRPSRWCERRRRSRWRGARSAEEHREMMEIVGEQADRLTHLVDTMFLLSRAEADGLPLLTGARLHRRHRLGIGARAPGAGCRPRCRRHVGRRHGGAVHRRQRPAAADGDQSAR